MKYSEIKSVDIADGQGIRVSLFVSGCTHHCPGCFNTETWDFNYGEEYTSQTAEHLLKLLNKPYINGLTLLGGEPFEEVNQKSLLELLRLVRERLPQKDIWAYTGYIYDRDLQPGGRAYFQETAEMLDKIDVLVDGPYIASRADISLAFRGSDNQRIIDLAETRRKGEICLWQG